MKLLWPAICLFSAGAMAAPDEVSLADLLGETGLWSEREVSLRRHDQLVEMIEETIREGCEVSNERISFKLIGIFQEPYYLELFLKTLEKSNPRLGVVELRTLVENIHKAATLGVQGKVLQSPAVLARISEAIYNLIIIEIDQVRKINSSQKVLNKDMDQHFKSEISAFNFLALIKDDGVEVGRPRVMLTTIFYTLTFLTRTLARLMVLEVFTDRDNPSPTGVIAQRIPDFSILDGSSYMHAFFLRPFTIAAKIIENIDEHGNSLARAAFNDEVHKQGLNFKRAEIENRASDMTKPMRDLYSPYR